MYQKRGITALTSKYSGMIVLLIIAVSFVAFFYESKAPVGQAGQYAIDNCKFLMVSYSDSIYNAKLNIINAQASKIAGNDIAASDYCVQANAHLTNALRYKSYYAGSCGQLDYDSTLQCNY